MLKQVLSQDFGEFSCGKAPHHIDLPQAVLRSHISLSKKQVIKVGGFDRRHTVSVTRHRDA
jgi:hypothetical protein